MRRIVLVLAATLVSLSTPAVAQAHTLGIDRAYAEPPVNARQGMNAWVQPVSCFVGDCYDEQDVVTNFWMYRSDCWRVTDHWVNCWGRFYTGTGRWICSATISVQYDTPTTTHRVAFPADGTTTCKPHG